MSLIVAARFTTFPAAESAAERLFSAGFVEEDVSLFFVNPRGQHARFPIGGDENKDAAAIDTPKGAGMGVTIGAVAGAVIGVGIFTAFSAPVLVSAIAAGVGAYIGSLIGAMYRTRGGGKGAHREAVHHHEERDSGVLLAVHVTPETQHTATHVLREAGGASIERATGRWQQGRWADFDPLRPPQPVQAERGMEGRTERHA
ncbi:hypothetical protein ACFQ3P_13390 [Paraburkholderia sabiae]|uniref:Glycine zipper domain-containing protein n=1 Tax=Paraburkholderia sabiae TaxID=273251 RepID=A0ABU9QCZ9_9BURK|nr:hypothetical protein [Paraburkholderia sabiae]WJZ76093.1 hypothetical protein QEN71_09930 [Paraburkholderia sabiae]CAD6526762.1 hypothetical protein LMG24235_01985 [Paraburkholderia sabiae]CAG9196470.1 conserved hypothetical protein [Paraburkholderia sabiae]